MDKNIFISVFLALICASLVEHLFISPYMAHSPTNEGIGALPKIPTSFDEALKLKYPNTWSIPRTAISPEEALVMKYPGIISV